MNAATNDKILLTTQHPEEFLKIWLEEKVKEIDDAETLCWLILAGKALSCSFNYSKALSALANFQSQDGRVLARKDAPRSWWATQLACLAWHGMDSCLTNKNDAIRFLLEASGEVIPRLPPEKRIIHHDTTLKGWSWIEATHSWIEPTAYALIALNISDHGLHPRIKEGGRLLLDRQLVKGGWNYGNTQVFDKMLEPLPECTGIALEALSSFTSNPSSLLPDLSQTFEWCSHVMPSLQTPLALSHMIFGMTAWNKISPNLAETLIKRCLNRYSDQILAHPAFWGMLMVAQHAGTVSAAAKCKLLSSKEQSTP